MGWQYSHTLIAVPKDFVPTPAQVRLFFEALVELEVLPTERSIVLRVPTGKTRTLPRRVGTNPKTGDQLVIEEWKVEIKDRKEVQTLQEFEGLAPKSGDYEVEISGVGTPYLPPLPITLVEPYYLGITVFVSSILRSTSNLHDDSAAKQEVVFYGRPCDLTENTGYFSNPHTLEVIKVEHAGAARFWIEFGLGKFLVPDLANGSLKVLNPSIVATAEKVFGIHFVQGCHWG